MTIGVQSLECRLSSNISAMFRDNLAVRANRRILPENLLLIEHAETDAKNATLRVSIRLMIMARGNCSISNSCRGTTDGMRLKMSWGDIPTSTDHPLSIQKFIVTSLSSPFKKRKRFLFSGR